METQTLKQIGATGAYVLLGMVGTAAMVLVALYVGQPLQPVIYDLFYLRVGPSEATETAILTHFLASAIIGLSVSMVVGDAISDRGTNVPTLSVGIAAMLALLLVFLVVALAGLAAFLTALVVLAIGLISVPLVLRYRAGVHSGGVPAFAGGVPIVILFILLAGFGLGWGWGYVMTAQEVPESSVTGPVAELDDVPHIRDDLLTGDCSTDTDGHRVCYLSLRGYEHEVRAAQFMARYGVRCPYQNTAGQSEAFVAEYDGTYYRITCSPHGD